MDIICCPPVSRKDQIAIGILKYEAGPDVAETQCQKCGILVHIGPLQQTMRMANPNLVVLCFKCSLPAAIKNSPIKELGGKGGKYLVDSTITNPKPNEQTKP